MWKTRRRLHEVQPTQRRAGPYVRATPNAPSASTLSTRRHVNAATAESEATFPTGARDP